MNIQTKFNIGDTIIFVCDSQLRKAVITTISVEVSRKLIWSENDPSILICYKFEDNEKRLGSNYVYEQDAFSSLEDLTKNAKIVDT